MKLSATHAFNCIVLVVKFGLTSCEGILPALFLDKINTWKVDKESVIINKHQIKAAYFKQEYISQCAYENVAWIDEGTVKLYHFTERPRSCRYTKFFGEELKIYCSYREMMIVAMLAMASPSTRNRLFVTLLTKVQVAFCIVEFCDLWLYAPWNWINPIPFHNTPLQSLYTSINCNGPCNRHFQYIISAYFSTINCCLWLQCY